MRLRNKFWLPFLFIIIGLTLVFVSETQAQGEIPPQADIIRGAVLYDNWFAALGVDAPTGNMPIWSRQTTNSRSGSATWRCVECHGWDYRGAQGAYASGSHFTGFPDVLTLASQLSETDIVNHLNGINDPAHNFSKYLDKTSMEQLAAFLKYGTIDDSLYIDPISMHVIGGDRIHGKTLFEGTCSTCHGLDGSKIIFRSEGIDENLGDVAQRDPWRFLHRTRFGVSGTTMPVGANLGWSPEDGRDVLAYVQTLPSQHPLPTAAPAVLVATPGITLGGPGDNWWNGLLTSFLVFFSAIGYVLVFIGGFLLIGLLVVILLRRKK
ncbi:MAG: c-type cytochrome [Anaerolineales bacterium]